MLMGPAAGVMLAAAILGGGPALAAPQDTVAVMVVETPPA